jgi:hypothetical protein
MSEPVTGDGTKDEPWVLRTPPGQSEYLAYRDTTAVPPTLVCVVGKTTLGYQLRCLEDLHTMLTEHGDWLALGSADEQKPAADGTVEAWARSPENPVGGWYGVPPVMEHLGLAELEHNPRNNHMRARASA